MKEVNQMYKLYMIFVKDSVTDLIRLWSATPELPMSCVSKVNIYRSRTSNRLNTLPALRRDRRIASGLSEVVRV